MLRSPGRNQREHAGILRQGQDRDEDIGNVRKVIAGRASNSALELCADDATRRLVRIARCGRARL